MSDASLGYCDEKECATPVKGMTDVVINHPSWDREINNRGNGINMEGINIVNPSPIGIQKENKFEF